MVIQTNRWSSLYPTCDASYRQRALLRSSVVRASKVVMTIGPHFCLTNLENNPNWISPVAVCRKSSKSSHALSRETRPPCTSSAQTHSNNMLSETPQFFKETWHIAVFLGTEILPLMLKFYLIFAILIGIIFFVYIIGMVIGAAFGFVNLDPAKENKIRSPKLDQTTPHSAGTEANPPQKASADSLISTKFVGDRDRKRRLEIEVEKLEEVLHERREELANFT